MLEDLVTVIFIKPETIKISQQISQLFSKTLNISCIAPILSRWCFLRVWGLPLSRAAHKLTGNLLFSSGTKVEILLFLLVEPWSVLRPHSQCLGQLVGLTVARWT